MPPMVTEKFESAGSGPLSIRDLTQILDEMPEDAVVTKLEIGDNQMDGAWWRVEARRIKK